MKVHPIEGYISKLYLIEEDHGCLLLDSGCRCDVAVVRGYLQNQLGLSLSDLKWVIVTHAHPDHMGAAREFQKLGVKTAGPEKANQWYKGIPGTFTYFVDMALTYYVAAKTRKKTKYKNVFFPRRLRFDKVLTEGDPLPDFKDWKVIECPGHTNCDLSIVHSQQKLAYVADNMISLKSGKVIRPYPLTDPAAYRCSLQRYLDLGVEEFLLAHYGPKSISADEIKSLISTTPERPRNHRNSLSKIIKRLLNG